MVRSKVKSVSCTADGQVALANTTRPFDLHGIESFVIGRRSIFVVFELLSWWLDVLVHGRDIANVCDERNGSVDRLYRWSCNE